MKTIFLFCMIAALGFCANSWSADQAGAVASVGDKIVAFLGQIGAALGFASDKVPAGGAGLMIAGFIGELLFLRLPKTSKPLSVARGVVVALRASLITLKAVGGAVVALLDKVIALVEKIADFLDKVLPQNVAPAVPEQPSTPPQG